MEPIDWQQVQLRGYPRLCEVIRMMEATLRRQEQTIFDLEHTVRSLLDLAPFAVATPTPPRPATSAATTDKTAYHHKDTQL